MDKERRKYYDTVKAYAMQKENVKTSESKDAYTVFLGREQLLRLTIRRDEIEAQFRFDSGIKTAVESTDVKIKEQPTVIVVRNENDVNAVIEAIDYKFGLLTASNGDSKNNG